MKAPDKIYISPLPNASDGYVGIAWADAHGKMEEYIRKDFLMEWMQQGFDWVKTPYISVQQIIDKINSL